MKAVAYAFEPAASVDAATLALREGGWGFKPVAGGQSLGAMLNLRLAQPETLVDLDGIAELGAVHETADHVFLGAMTTHAAIEDGRVPDPSGGLMPFASPTAPCATAERSAAVSATPTRPPTGLPVCRCSAPRRWWLVQRLDATSPPRTS